MVQRRWRLSVFTPCGTTDFSAEIAFEACSVRDDELDPRRPRRESECGSRSRRSRPRRRQLPIPSTSPTVAVDPDGDDHRYGADAALALRARVSYGTSSPGRGS